MGEGSHSVFAQNCGGNGVDAMIEGPQHAGDYVQGNYIAFVFSQSAGNTMDLTCSVYACLAEAGFYDTRRLESKLNHRL